MPNWRDEFGTNWTDSQNEKPLAALGLLMRAATYADDTSTSIWEFAVTLSELRRAGLTETDLRLLVRKRILQHAIELVSDKGTARKFKNQESLRFTESSCFVLTEKGVFYIRSLHSFPAENELDEVVERFDQLDFPHWDAEERELRVGQDLVKRYQSPARSQEFILTLFEQRGWPRAIEDPFTQSPEPDNNLLHNVVQTLNRKQINQRIHFRCSSGGRVISWELVDERDA